MSADKQNANCFDAGLKCALKSHSEPAPLDFTEKVLRQIRQSQEQKILARVVVQERLALTGCIILAIVFIVLTVALPGVAAGLTLQAETLSYKIDHALQTVGSRWQLCITFMAAFVFAVYYLVDSLVADTR
ncbi:MAG TPA: hypothetical protein VMW16_04725 [Sedimentisphaerales bacterium]|nr:hypothetical protein [Sedimentisphaerales bacterium]